MAWILDGTSMFIDNAQTLLNWFSWSFTTTCHMFQKLCMFFQFFKEIDFYNFTALFLKMFFQKWDSAGINFWLHHFKHDDILSRKYRWSLTLKILFDIPSGEYVSAWYLFFPKPGFFRCVTSHVTLNNATFGILKHFLFLQFLLMYDANTWDQWCINWKAQFTLL